MRIAEKEDEANQIREWRLDITRRVEALEAHSSANSTPLGPTASNRARIVKENPNILESIKEENQETLMTNTARSGDAKATKSGRTNSLQELKEINGNGGLMAIDHRLLKIEQNQLRMFGDVRHVEKVVHFECAWIGPLDAVLNGMKDAATRQSSTVDEQLKILAAEVNQVSAMQEEARTALDDLKKTMDNAQAANPRREANKPLRTCSESTRRLKEMMTENPLFEEVIEANDFEHRDFSGPACGLPEESDSDEDSELDEDEMERDPFASEPSPSVAVTWHNPLFLNTGADGLEVDSSFDMESVFMESDEDEEETEAFDGVWSHQPVNDEVQGE